jgi:hypothetical protein
MTYFDYKAVPAPRRAKKSRGVKSASDLFALTITEVINEHARQGWEYLRAERLPSAPASGWFRKAVEQEETLLVFRRPRETLGPKLAAANETAPDDAIREIAGESRPARTTREPIASGRVEPSVEDRPSEAAAPVTSPLRAAPQLGPAERS